MDPTTLDIRNIRVSGRELKRIEIMLIFYTENLINEDLKLFTIR